MGFYLSILMAFAILYWDPVLYAEQWTGRGVVRADAEVRLGFRASGEVGLIKVREGQPVAKGTLLLELRNNKDKLIVSLTEAKLRNVKARLQEARVLVEMAERNLKRMRKLEDVVPEVEREKAELQYRQYRAALEATEALVVEQAVELAYQMEKMEDTRVRAPFDGIITEINLKEGDVVEGVKNTTCTLVKMDVVRVDVAVPAKYFLKTLQDMFVSVHLEGIMPSEEKLEGKASYISPVIDASSGTFMVKVTLSNEGYLLRPGMMVNVSLDFPDFVQKDAPGR